MKAKEKFFKEKAVVYGFKLKMNEKRTLNDILTKGFCHYNQKFHEYFGDNFRIQADSYAQGILYLA